MPIYNYRCSACGDASQILHKMSDPKPGQCPACGAENSLSKLVSRSGFALKGGGWYADGYGASASSASSDD